MIAGRRGSDIIMLLTSIGTKKSASRERLFCYDFLAFLFWSLLPEISLTWSVCIGVASASSVSISREIEIGSGATCRVPKDYIVKFVQDGRD